MSYVTDYEITIALRGADVGTVSQYIFKQNEWLEEFNLDINDEEICIKTITTWRTFYEDMIELTQEFPNIRVFIEGNGADRYDVWEMIVENGMAQRRGIQAFWQEWKDFSI